MKRRSYTVETANRTLPYVRSVVAEMIELYREIQAGSDRHARIDRKDTEWRRELRRGIQAKADRLHECQEELRAIGVELKDYELGLIDFPAELDDRPILLCWKRGEESVGHWHEIDAGFVDRQAIPPEASQWPASATVSPAARD